MSLESLSVGSGVSLLRYREGEPGTVVGTIESVEPLTVSVQPEPVQTWHVGDRVVLLAQTDGKFQSAEAKVGVMTVGPTKVHLALSGVEWNVQDRRSHPRFAAKLLATCRYVVEEKDKTTIKEFTVTTRDISQGGVWVTSDAPPALGSVLDVTLATGPNETLKALGLVAWVDPQGRGFGVEFVDLSASAQATLSAFLRRAAA